ncbi:hypothetical protein NIES4101_70160 [Calothrix sp. NIES-4101]|nr:hypothetical protein NIES4101_70160 [Calothrix sp. NIES-4101]
MPHITGEMFSRWNAPKGLKTQSSRYLLQADLWEFIKYYYNCQLSGDNVFVCWKLGNRDKNQSQILLEA